jgi:hypothetical protein
VYIGKSCRSKVTKDLNKQFESPEVAEQHYLTCHVSGSTLPEPVSSQHSVTLPPPSLPSVLKPQPTTVHQGVEYCRVGISGFSCDDKLRVLTALHTDVGSFPSDFLYLAVKAMDHLRASGRSND